MESDAPHREWDLLASPWHLDEHIEGFPIPQSTTVIAPPGGRPLQSLSDHYRLTADAVAGVARPLLLSGDCITALGIVAGLQRRHGDVSLVWVDAHGDFNTPAISASGYLAGMSLAMLTGRAPEPFCEPLGLRPVPDRNAVLVDARDLDPAERAALEASDVRRVAADPDAIREALDQLPRSAVYLHVDVDIVDGAHLPGLRFPVGEGPTFSLVEECLAEIVAAVPPAGACIACAWSPEAIADELTMHSLTRIAAAIGAKLSWPAGDTSHSY